MKLKMTHVISTAEEQAHPVGMALLGVGILTVTDPSRWSRMSSLRDPELSLNFIFVDIESVYQVLNCCILSEEQP